MVPPARGRSRAPPSEAELWRKATRDVRPLPQRTKPAPTAAPPVEIAEPVGPPRRAPRAADTPARPLPPIEPARAPGLDRSSAERLKRGRYPIEARLDLHGMIQ